MTPDVIIYTDGACSGNPGPGGWGAILMSRGHEREIMGGEILTTNNRMEMTAAIRALEALKRPLQGRAAHRQPVPAPGDHRMVGGLEGARLAHRRQEAGEE